MRNSDPLLPSIFIFFCSYSNKRNGMKNYVIQVTLFNRRQKEGILRVRISLVICVPFRKGIHSLVHSLSSFCPYKQLPHLFLLAKQTAEKTMSETTYPDAYRSSSGRSGWSPSSSTSPSSSKPYPPPRARCTSQGSGARPTHCRFQRAPDQNARS